MTSNDRMRTVYGNAYGDQDEERGIRDASYDPPTEAVDREPQKEASKDFSSGQIVILIARWLLIGAGFLITLWSPEEKYLDPIKITLIFLFGLAVANFYLHAQLLMKRPVRALIVYAASAVDIAVVTIIIAAFGSGLNDPLFVFYYPALLALALVFPLAVTCSFTVGLMLVYVLVGLSLRPDAAELQVLVARMISLVAVAAVGATYQFIERRRHANASSTHVPARTTPLVEAREDLYYGQVVIIIARWALILAGIVVSLWSAKSIADVSVPVMLMGVLMAMNFYLHGRYLVNQPVNAKMVYLSSFADIVIVTLIVLFWTQGKGPGIHSPLFVFLYPALLSFALVFPPRITALFSAVTLLSYVGVVLVGSGMPDVNAQKTLVERLITLAATAGLGTYFWRIQRNRRRVAQTAHDGLLDEVAVFTDGR